ALLPPEMPGINQQTAIQALAETVLLSTYTFEHYKKQSEEAAPLNEIFIVSTYSGGEKALKEGEILGRAVNMARDLGNHPSNVATPSHLAKHAQELSKNFPKIRVRILDRAGIKKEGMGALLAVAQGSDEEPRFIILEYHGKKSGAPVVLIGKGVTFDSGGLSLKPWEKMDEMKFDMMGGAAVIGALRTIAALDLPVNVVGLVPATENLPSGSAYRPGDILRGMGGKTIEVLNTDAEGRVILSDALEYAKRYKPALVVDVATLTGACIHAVGEEYAGLFTRDAKIKKCIEDAAEMTNEPVWQLPLDDSHVHSIKSYVADVKNIGERKPGASTAAAFLEFFTDYPWAHLDIAGQMAYGKPQPFQRQGARGFGVHLLTQVVRNWFKV
ncbi:MAG TPA: leucyl aminopeptidase, partial [Candidatus Magasanikbacteria bacterium]|nr:leucyl aminopeptidase [Candidatus Magasanikbacteria bacterium]